MCRALLGIFAGSPGAGCCVATRLVSLSESCRGAQLVAPNTPYTLRTVLLRQAGRTVSLICSCAAQLTLLSPLPVSRGAHTNETPAMRANSRSIGVVVEAAVMAVGIVIIVINQKAHLEICVGA